MTSPLQREIEQALHGTFAIERELGGGGMSRVFLATEQTLRRRVVIKVLSPELARGVSADRFRREIEVAASLQHPHIVPVLAAGEAGGHLYFTMPYIEGESLRARLSREGEVPVPIAVRILADVARALALAHRRGIVHRDIKPENVLLAEGLAQVADFGIAKALAASSDRSPLTSAGLALGTPVYMAPEQAMADPATDHRADLYALGVLGYEMLAGQPPFAGRTPQQLVAAHATETPVPLGQRRPSVPPALARLVMRLLHKRPADRPQSADEVLATLESVGTPAEGIATVEVRRAPSRPSPWLVLGGVAAAALVLALVFLRERTPLPPTDSRVVAIAPFRVSGADSSLRYLREGMVDLLAAKLGGTTTLRPTDPRTLLVAWNRADAGAGDLAEQDALGVARAVGAGRLVEGEVVGAGPRLSVSARIMDVAGGATLARATAEGSVDSVTQLVDRLAASLLVLGAGEEEQRLDALTSTSLPALRAYLDGEALLRRGVFLEAERKFLDAVALDTSFALAALGAARAGEWRNAGEEGATAAWQHRHRLGRRDMARLVAFLGPRYPAGSSVGELIAAAERLVELAPDSPDAWYKLGDQLFHFGAAGGVRDPYRRASAAYGRSLALDSTYAPTIQHLSEVAAGLGDTAGIRRGLEILLRIDSVSPNAISRRWHVAALLGDTAGIRSALASDSTSNLGFVPFYIIAFALDTPLDLQGTDAIFPRAIARGATAAERSGYEMMWSRYEVMRGRPSRAPPLSGSPEPVRLFLAATDALFADGDTARGRAAAAALERQLGRPLRADDLDQGRARYAAGQYALAEGRYEPVRRAIADLRNPQLQPGSEWQVEFTHPYALILEAQLAAALRQPGADDLRRRLDSALADPVGITWASYGNLVAARLHEERGDLSAALAAVRRRTVGVATFPHYVTSLRHEGRLAALTGDRTGAIRAYRHYLALRSEAEPALQPQVRAVRAELEALEREPTDR